MSDNNNFFKIQYINIADENKYEELVAAPTMSDALAAFYSRVGRENVKESPVSSKLVKGRKLTANKIVVMCPHCGLADAWDGLRDKIFECEDHLVTDEQCPECDNRFDVEYEKVSTDQITTKKQVEKKASN